MLMPVKLHLCFGTSQRSFSFLLFGSKDIGEATLVLVTVFRRRRIQSDLIPIFRVLSVRELVVSLTELGFKGSMYSS